ncbi:DNA-directed RNA polymerase, partial [Puccinia sorghi]
FHPKETKSQQPNIHGGKVRICANTRMELQPVGATRVTLEDSYIRPSRSLMAGLLRHVNNGRERNACRMVNRQTLGQYFEMVRGELIFRGLEIQNIVGATDWEDRHLWVMSEGTEVREDVRASYGRCYMLPMTQLAQDKQHYSHNTSGIASLSPVVGRSRGGAVRLGEMKSLAMAASGLLACLRELRDRGDMVVVDVCNTCNSVEGLCGCLGNPVSCKMALPSSTLAFLDALACMYDWAHVVLKTVASLHKASIIRLYTVITFQVRLVLGLRRINGPHARH